MIKPDIAFLLRNYRYITFILWQKYNCRLTPEDIQSGNIIDLRYVKFQNVQNVTVSLFHSSSIQHFQKPIVRRIESVYYCPILQ